jgi:hypothetical protein
LHYWLRDEGLQPIMGCIIGCRVPPTRGCAQRNAFLNSSCRRCLFFILHSSFFILHFSFFILTQNVLPSPGLLSKPMAPPWLATMLWQMARPSPLPPEARDLALSTR